MSRNKFLRFGECGKYAENSQQSRTDQKKFPTSAEKTLGAWKPATNNPAVEIGWAFVKAESNV